MSNNIKLFILIMSGSVICRIHLSSSKRSYKRLLEEKQETSTEDIYKYLYDLSKIQANSDVCYFFLILLVVVLFFKV